MAVTSTTGIRDDLHLQRLDTQIDNNVRARTDAATAAELQSPQAAHAVAALDGEAVLAMDAWNGTPPGERLLGTSDARLPSVSGLSIREGIDASAAHVLKVLD